MNPNSEKRQIDLIISGSGSRLIAQVGAIKRLEEAGFGFRRIAGTSGGAIVGALLAAGYTGDELYQIIQTLNWKKVRDRKLLSPVSLYQGNYIETFIKTLLDKKHVRDFQAVPQLHIVASDITNSKMLVFSALTPDEAVYKAVRCSMSIPLVFTSQVYRGACVVDGGIHANYPIGLFDDNADCPTIGIKMIDKGEDDPNPIYMGWNPIKYHWTRAKALMVTLLRQQDNLHIEDIDWNTRTIKIFTAIPSTDFALAPAQVQTLHAQGYQAAETFLQSYDYTAAQSAGARALSTAGLNQDPLAASPTPATDSAPSA